MSYNEDDRRQCEMLEGLRRSHCAAEGRNHPCRGKLTITEDGFDLDCVMCGGQRTWAKPIKDGRATELARRIVSAAGVKWDALTAEYQFAAVEAACREFCPGCGKQLPMDYGSGFGAHRTCKGCGQWYREWDGWRKRSNAEEKE